MSPLMMRRVPELDALRAFAAIAILVFHLNPSAFAFGWTGVDLFFVLSGYLITTIIIGHHESPRFLLNFYMRRGLRIWPIYYLILCSLLLLNPHLPHPYSTRSVPYYLTYTQNVPLYWTNKIPPIIAPFDHSWTLALEEQFYLLWPALVHLVGSRRVLGLCLLATIVAVVARTGMSVYFVVPVGFQPLSERLLLGRCDGFALGGLLAALLFDKERLARRLNSFRVLFGLVGLAALGYLWWGISRSNAAGFMGLPTPPNPASTILAVSLLYFGVVGAVLCFIDHPALAVLRWPPLVYLGRISYGIYLYHYVIFWMVDGFSFQYNQPWWIRASKLAATFVAAVISWHAIEQPILSLKDRFRYEPWGTVESASGVVGSPADGDAACASRQMGP